jgi:hypothetical protein
MKTVCLLLLLFAIHVHAVPTIDRQFVLFGDLITDYTFTVGSSARAEYSLDLVNWRLLADWGYIQPGDSGSRVTFSPGPDSLFPMYFIRAVEY